MPCSEPPFHIPHIVFLLQILPFVIELFALSHADLHLDLAVLEIDFQGNQRQSLFLGLAVETLDLPFVEQQFSHPQVFVIGTVAVGIGSDMHVMEKDFSILDKGIAVFQIGLPVAQRLHLRTDQDNPRFIGIVDEIIQSRRFILADDFLRTILLLIAPLFLHSGA